MEKVSSIPPRTGTSNQVVAVLERSRFTRGHRGRSDADLGILRAVTLFPSVNTEGKLKDFIIEHVLGVLDIPEFKGNILT